MLLPIIDFAGMAKISGNIPMAILRNMLNGYSPIVYGWIMICAQAIIIPWNRTLSTEKRDIFLNTAEYISGHRQPAEIATPLKALLQSRIDCEGKITQVSVTNITVADCGDAVLRVLNPASRRAVLRGQNRDESILALNPTETEGLYEITLPDLKPWAVATVFFE